MLWAFGVSAALARNLGVERFTPAIVAIVFVVSVTTAGAMGVM